MCKRHGVTINFDQIKKLMAFDIQKKYCIEIEFAVNGSDKFGFCWMGKLPDKETGKDVYWFGLTPDGKNAFDYFTFEELSTAKVFDGKSLFEIWGDITIWGIDSCDPMERLLVYIGEENL